MRADDALGHQHEDHEHGADGIEHELDREHRHPGVGEVRLRRTARGCRAGSAASARSRAAPARSAPASAVSGSRAAPATVRRRSASHRPRRGAAPNVSRTASAVGSSCMPTAIQTIAPSTRPGMLGFCPWNTRAAFQTMAQAIRPMALSSSGTTSPKRLAAQRPQRDRGRPEQIGRAPPAQRQRVFLPAEEQQHGAEQRRDHRGDDIKRHAVEHHRSPRLLMQHVRSHGAMLCNGDAIY